MTFGRVGPEPVAGGGGTPVERDVVVGRLRAAGCVFAEDEAELLLSDAANAAELEVSVARRVAGEPLEYVVGWAEFAGHRFAVEQGVFVPRHRTEFLVEQAVALARDFVATGPGIQSVPPVVVLDLCCGSGAIGATIAAALAADGAAVDPARHRHRAGGGGVRAISLAPVGTCLKATCSSRYRPRFGLGADLSANVPYVPTDEIALMPPEAPDDEARVTLDGGSDGLAVLRRVAAAAPPWLAPGGHLLVETANARRWTRSTSCPTTGWPHGSRRARRPGAPS